MVVVSFCKKTEKVTTKHVNNLKIGKGGMIMTEEQIKQNADIYADKLYEDGRCTESTAPTIQEIYIAGAHSRDVEIYDLKRDIEDLQKMVKMRSDAYECARKEIDRLSNPWIRVEDRLPKGEDNPDEYNAPHRARSSSNVIITDGSIINRGYYSYARMRWEWNGGEIKVTHWMPIPELKKGE
jgi:hypothetical protein